MNVFLLLILFTVRSVRSIILIPEEVPSLLSIVYSNIPPVLKGTDSRLGIGFRLGPNADFQYQIELGPQTRTQTIGPDAPAPEANKKRHVAQQQNQLGSLPGKDKPHWIYTWNNINPGSASKDKDSLDLEPTQDDMTNQFHYQPDQVASHLSQLYQQSTLNKQRTTSTTKKPEIRESPKESIRSDIDNPIKHRLASPTNPTGELHLPKTEEIVEKNSPHVDRNDRIQPIDLSKLVVNSNISHINSNIPLEKPKPVKSSKGTQSSHSEDDQEISETENHETVSESETEDRLKEIHALTHSQFIQRVPVSQAKEKSP